MCRYERDRRRELEAAVRAAAQEEKKDRDETAAELAQKEALREKARAAKCAQKEKKEKKAQERMAAFVERKKKRKALAAQQREDAERARLGTLWREKFYYLLCAIMRMVVVAGLLYAWFFSSLMEPVKAAGGPVLVVLGMALLVPDLPTMCRFDGSIFSGFYALCFALLGVAHLVVPLGLLFADATSALYQGFTSEGLQYERPAVDVGSFAQIASAVMQCITNSNIPVLLWAYAYATIVLPLWALADSRPFRAASIAFAFVVAPYTFVTVARSLILSCVDDIVCSVVGVLVGCFLALVGQLLGSRVASLARECPSFVGWGAGWAGAVFGLYDGGRLGGSFNWWMLVSAASTIRSVISWVLSLAYSKRTVVLYLGLMVVAYKLAVMVVGALVARLARAARIERHHLERADGSINVGTGSTDATQPGERDADAGAATPGSSNPPIITACSGIDGEAVAKFGSLFVACSAVAILVALGAAAGLLLYYYNYLLVGVASLLWGTLLFDRIGQFYPHPLVRPVCFLVALTYVTAADDQAFVLSAPLVMLGLGFDGVLGSFRFTGMAMAFALYLYGFMGLAVGLALAVVGVPVMRSSWAALRDVHCLEGGGSFIISVRTAASTFALLITGLALWYYDILGSLIETVGTASSASGDAIATYFTRGTDCMGSLTVYAVLLVTVTVVGVLRVRDAKPHVPNNVPGAFASNTCKDTCCGAGTSFFSRWPTSGMSFISRGPTFQIWAKDATGESIPLDVTGSTTVENLKQMIWEKVGIPAAEQFLKFGAKMLEDGRTLSDYNIQMASTVDLLLFVCGGAPKKNTKWCDRCSTWIISQGFKSHYKFCGVKKKDATTTTAPDGYEETPWKCATCWTPKALNALGEMCWTCRSWGDPGHPGHPDYVAFRQAKYQLKNDKDAAARAAASGGRPGRSRGDDRIKWDQTYPGASNGETRNQALKRFAEENPKWRHSAQIPQFKTLALLLGVDDWRKVPPQLSKQDPADEHGYVSRLTYRRFVDACLTLSSFPGGDKMFGGIAPLTIKFVGGLVHGAIACCVATRIRAIKGLNRKNAAGDRSRKAFTEAIYRWANRDDDSEAAASLLKNDKLSGLRGPAGYSWFKKRWGDHGLDVGLTTDCLVSLRDTGIRIFQIAGHELSSFIGCDFGNLGKQDIIYQARNVKRDGERNVGDSTTRAVSRPLNNAIARAFSAYKGLQPLTFAVKLHSGLIIVYENLKGFHWQGNLIAAYKHFSETYDPVAFAKKSERSWHAWLEHQFEEDGCGGVCDGYDMCFWIDGVRYGRDLLREAMDLALYDAIDRNLLRIARGIDWNLSYLPTVEWSSDETLLSLRTSCLEAGMGAADDALRLYKLYFEKQMAVALASGQGVTAALESGYAVLREGPARFGSAAAFLNDVRQKFARVEVPAILRELAQPRRVEFRTYTMQGASNELWSAPAVTFESVERAVSDDAAAALRSSDTRTPPSSPVREHSAGPTAFSIGAAAKRAADGTAGGTKARRGGPKGGGPPGSQGL